MAWVGEWGKFVHIPKTGGTAMRKHLGMGREEGTHHGMPESRKNTFALVRHPVAWYRSLWAYLNKHNWECKPSSPPQWHVILGMVERVNWEDFPGDRPIYQHVMNLYPVEEYRRLEDQDMPVAHATLNKPIVTAKMVRKIEAVEREIMERYDYEMFCTG